MIFMKVIRYRLLAHRLYKYLTQCMCHLVMLYKDSRDLSSTIRIDESVVRGRTGTFYISFAPVDRSTYTESLTNFTQMLVANASYYYNIKTNTIGCYYFDEGTSSLSSQGCIVSLLSWKFNANICMHVLIYAHLCSFVFA